MNKKFVNVMLALAVSCGSLATFTSCKDTDDDLRVEWSKGDADLQKKIDALQAQIDALVRAQAQCKADCQASIQNYFNILMTYVDKQDQSVINYLDGKIKGFNFNALWDSLAELQRQINDLKGKNSGLTEAQVNALIQKALNEAGFLTPADLEGYLTDEDIADFIKSGELEALVNKLVVITTLRSDVDDIQDYIDTILKPFIEDVKNGVYDTGLNEDQVQDLIDTAIQVLDTDLRELIKTLNTDLANYKEKTDGEIADLEARVAALEATIKELQTIKDRLTQIENRLSTAEQNAINAYLQAQSNLTKLNLLQAVIGDHSKLEGTVVDEILALKQKYTDLFQKIESDDAALREELLELIKGNTEQIEGLRADLGIYEQNLMTLTSRVNENKQAIEELQEQVNKLLKLEERLNSLITSVIVQGTFNPLFGNFSLPIGVQSNILVNYYGKSEKQTYTFPSQQSFATFNNEDEVTADELRMLAASGYTTYSVENGAILIDDKSGNLGRVFVTINPNNIDFGGKQLKLVNSQDKEATVTLSNLRPSKELLTFGYSRGGGNNNGFYEADANLAANEADVAGVSVGIHENLKTAMKDILKDKRQNLRSNVVSLMKAVYDQFNGILPAYALKAPWKVDEKEYAVYSNYNIAATTFKPLSYSFLYDKGLDNKIPTFDPIKDAILNIDPSKYHFDLSGVNVDVEPVEVNFQLEHITITYDNTIGIEGTVTIDGEDFPIEGNIPKGDLDAFLGEINKQLNEKIDHWNKQLQDSYNDAMKELVSNVKDAVEQALEDLQGKINGQIDDMINDIQDEINNKVGSYIDKFNKFIDAYNRIAGKLNDILANPNHYLQPTMLYNAGSGLHFLSNNSAAPTKFVAAGGNAITLYATSYTGEVVAPAFKKFVAVVNVTDNATGKTAQGGDAALVDELKSINAGEYLADVRPGTQRRFALDASKMKAGHTYEILYTAVDYLGVTSTARYYISVAK